MNYYVLKSVDGRFEPISLKRRLNKGMQTSIGQAKQTKQQKRYRRNRKNIPHGNKISQKPRI